MPKQLVWVAAVGGANRDPGAGADMDILPVEKERLGQLSNGLTGHELCVIRMTQLANDESKLVAAEASNGIHLAHATGKPACRLSKQSVTGRMAEGIVDVLEVIQIQDHER